MVERRESLWKTFDRRLAEIERRVTGPSAVPACPRDDAGEKERELRRQQENTARLVRELKARTAGETRRLRDENARLADELRALRDRSGPREDLIREKDAAIERLSVALRRLEDERMTLERRVSFLELNRKLRLRGTRRRRSLKSRLGNWLAQPLIKISW